MSVTAADFLYAPNEWVVPAGEEILVTFSNQGATGHDWAVLNLGERVQTEDDYIFALLDGREVVFDRIDEVPAGDSTTKTLTFDEPGIYQVICTLPDHLTAGMEGTITVED